MILEATFRHSDGWPILSITESPQTMVLTVTNRASLAVGSLGEHSAEFTLLFRPGALVDAARIALAPESTVGWTLVTTERAEGTELRFVARASLVIEPGRSTAIRLDGLAPNPSGGSRVTRVEFSVGGLVSEDVAHTPVAETHVLLVRVLRRHEDELLTMRDVRSGTVARSGPFLAGFLGPARVVNDGVTQNQLTVRIVNRSDRAISVATDGDEATRFTLDYSVGDAIAPWGLLGSRHDHVVLRVANDEASQWDSEHIGVVRRDANPWRRREVLDLELTVFTTASVGRAQLVVSYENLPGHDDGDLVLELDVVAPWALDGDGTASGSPDSVRIGEWTLRAAIVDGRSMLLASLDGATDSTTIADSLALG